MTNTDAKLLFGLLMVSPLLASFACAAMAACTPAQRADMGAALPVVEKVSCVLLRAATESGTVDEVCATADELAPLVPDLLAERKEHPQWETDAGPRLVLAFAMNAPKRRPPPRRHCTQWTAVDAGADARGD